MIIHQDITVVEETRNAKRIFPVIDHRVKGHPRSTERAVGDQDRTSVDLVIQLLLVYSVGLGLPLLLTSLAVNTFLTSFQKIISYVNLPIESVKVSRDREAQLYITERST